MMRDVRVGSTHPAPAGTRHEGNGLARRIIVATVLLFSAAILGVATSPSAVRAASEGYDCAVKEPKCVAGSNDRCFGECSGHECRCREANDF